jgi:hypothetical protein
MVSELIPVLTIDGTSGDEEEPDQGEEEESDGSELSEYYPDYCTPSIDSFTEQLSKGWHSPVYDFFKPEVKVGYDGKRKYHFFPCAAKRCKGLKGIHGVRRFQDSKDCAATLNLKGHAVKCFGQDVVDAAFDSKRPKSQDSSIFAIFARQGQQPARISHRAHTKAETW